MQDPHLGINTKVTLCFLSECIVPRKQSYFAIVKTRKGRDRLVFDTLSELTTCHDHEEIKPVQEIGLEITFNSKQITLFHKRTNNM